MPADPTLVGDARLAETVRALIADVLMVPLDDVRPHAALVAELGAESVDFLDLVFRLEDALGKKIPVNRWQEFVRQRLGGADLSRAITPEIVIEFARGEAG
jgi:acyl carrier protein